MKKKRKTRLTEEKREKIISARLKGYSYREIARVHRIAPSSAYYIWNMFQLKRSGGRLV